MKIAHPAEVSPTDFEHVVSQTAIVLVLLKKGIMTHADLAEARSQADQIVRQELAESPSKSAER